MNFGGDALTAFLESPEEGAGTPYTPHWLKVSLKGYSQALGNSLQSPGPTAPTPALSGSPHQETEQDHPSREKDALKVHTFPHPPTLPPPAPGSRQREG